MTFMELVIFVAGLCVVGVLGQRFGYDSRPSADSKEKDLAGFGVGRDHPGTTAGRRVPVGMLKRLLWRVRQFGEPLGACCTHWVEATWGPFQPAVEHECS